MSYKNNSINLELHSFIFLFYFLFFFYELDLLHLHIHIIGDLPYIPGGYWAQDLTLLLALIREEEVPFELELIGCLLVCANPAHLFFIFVGLCELCFSWETLYCSNVQSSVCCTLLSTYCISFEL